MPTVARSAKVIFDSSYGHLSRLGLIAGGRTKSVDEGWKLTALGRLLLRTIEATTERVVPFPGAQTIAPTAILSFWEELAAEMSALAQQHSAEFGPLCKLTIETRDINFTASRQLPAQETAFAHGFVSTHDRWIWLQYDTGSNQSPPEPLLIHLGTDQYGPYWKHHGRRRTSKKELARFMLGPLLKPV